MGQYRFGWYEWRKIYPWYKWWWINLTYDAWFLFVGEMGKRTSL